MIYPLIRDVLFNFDAENVHYFSMNALKAISGAGFARQLLGNQFSFTSPSLHRDLMGLQFKNPVGLGAGFDKNALFLRELELLGFGFVEIGTVTPKPQAGNDKPRLFRLVKDQAIINRMGFNNDGVKQISARLRERAANQTTNWNRRMVVGGNIGKNKNTPNEEAWRDYEICFNELFDCVDYFVVNVSSPNTPGLRALQEKDALLKILSHLQILNHGKSAPKPLLLKIAPDLTVQQVDDIIDLSAQVQLSGLVATNTTISRENLATPKETVEKIGPGGLSGKPLRNRSTELLQYIQKQTSGSLPVIASGGIFTGEDAREKLQAGAMLIQVWTGFVYEGPSIAKKICEHLAR